MLTEGRNLARLSAKCGGCKQEAIFVCGDRDEEERQLQSFIFRHVGHTESFDVQALYERRIETVNVSFELGGRRGEAGPGEEADAARH